MREELRLQPDELTVIATGGLAPLVVEECAVVHRAPALADPARASRSSSPATPDRSDIGCLEVTSRSRSDIRCRRDRRERLGLRAMSDEPQSPAAEDDLPEQMRVRRDKRERLVEAGVAPYPVTVERTHTLAPGPRRRTTPSELEPDTRTGEQVAVDRARDLPAQHRQALLRPAARGRRHRAAGDAVAGRRRRGAARGVQGARRPRRPAGRAGRGDHQPPRRAVRAGDRRGRSRRRRCARCPTSTGRCPTRPASGCATST